MDSDDDDDYFMMKPEKAIKSHMPFDPLWQFLNYPITSTEFYEDEFENLWNSRQHTDMKLRLMKQCFDASVLTMDPVPARRGPF